MTNEQKPSLTRLGTGRNYLEGNPLANRAQPGIVHSERPGDWESLHRKAVQDSQRHEELVQEALEKGLGEALGEESFGVINGKKRLKVTIRFKEEYKFRFAEGKKGGTRVGSGDGKSKVGDVLAHDKTGQKGRGQDEGAGGSGGNGDVEYDEREVERRKVMERVFDGLELPVSNRTADNTTESDNVKFTDVRKAGPLGNLDKRRTIKENIKRNAAHGNPRFGGVRREDMRYKVWEYDKKQIDAVAFFILDVSDSMDEGKRKAAKAAAQLQVAFLETKYPHVKRVFIAHATNAREMSDANKFFSAKGGLGWGTEVHAALQLTRELIAKKFNPQTHDIYINYAGDGADQPDKDAECRREVEQLLTMDGVQQIAFIETQTPYAPKSTLRNRLEQTALKTRATDKLAIARMPDASHAVEVLRTLYPKKDRRAA